MSISLANRVGLDDKKTVHFFGFIPGIVGCGKTHTMRECVRRLVKSGESQLLCTRSIDSHSHAGRKGKYVSYQWATAVHAKVGCVTLHSVVHQGLLNKALKYYLKGKVWKEVQSALKDLEVSAGYWC